MQTEIPKLHQTIQDIQVSVYTSAKDAASKKYMRLQEIVDIIVTGRPLLSNPQRSIRNIQEELRFRQQDLSKQEYQEWKATNLPMFLVTGCFEHRSTTGLIGPHSALINIDIDHIENVEILKQTIADNEPSLILAGISPSGDGLKLIFNVSPTPTDATEHKIIASQLHQYLSTKYAIPMLSDQSESGIDPAGTKLTFTCFFFYDPNLYVNTKVPSKFQGTLRVSKDEYTPKTNEIFNWTKLQSCLDFYTPDCSYDEWCQIGMALKHEGSTRGKEELFYQQWYEWSATSEQKFNPSIMQDKWQSFNQENDEQITLGSIYHNATKDGWEPPQPSSTEKTENNKQSLEQRELENYAIEQKLPMYLRPTPPESTDLARLMHYERSKFLIINDSRIYIQTRRGAWEEVSVEQSNGRIDNLLQQARTAALQEALHHQDGGQEYHDRLHKSFRDSNSHIKALTGRLLSIIENSDYNNIPSIQDKDFNNRTTTNPTLPLKDGAIDLATGHILSPEEYATYHQLHTERWAAEYDPDILNRDTPGIRIAQHLIREHYGEELFNRIAYHLVRPSKSVDIIIMPRSNSGKTALAEWLKNSIGSVEIDSRSRSLTSRGDTYSQGTAPLTECLLYFYDEVDKLYEDIPVGVLNEMTAETLTIGKKFQNPTPRTRIGTPILIGADWPPIDATAQGIDTRINFTYKKITEPMASEIKLHLISDEDTHKYLLAWIVQKATQFHQNNTEWISSSEATESRNEFIELRTPEIKKILKSTYEESSSANDHVTSSHINETVNVLGKKPTNLDHIITSVFPTTKKVRRRIIAEGATASETNAVFVYQNLRLRTVPVDDDNIDDKITELPASMQEESAGLLYP